MLVQLTCWKNIFTHSKNIKLLAPLYSWQWGHNGYNGAAFSQAARNTLRFEYRNSKLNAAFIPGGGAWQDYALGNELYFRSGLYLKSRVQFEDIARLPILFTGRQRNVTATVEFGFRPAETGG